MLSIIIKIPFFRVSATIGPIRSLFIVCYHKLFYNEIRVGMARTRFAEEERQIAKDRSFRPTTSGAETKSTSSSNEVEDVVRKD